MFSSVYSTFSCSDVLGLSLGSSFRKYHSNVFESREDLSELLFGTDNYIRKSLSEKNLPEPATLYKAILNSFDWDSDKFKGIYSKQEVKELAKIFRQKTHLFILSNPTFSDGRTLFGENTREFSADIYNELMFWKYQAQFYVWSSIALHTGDFDYGMNRLNKYIDTSIFSKFLTQDILSRDKSLNNAINALDEIIKRDLNEYLKGNMRIEEFAFKLSHYQQAKGILLKLRDEIQPKARGDIIKQFSVFRGYFLPKKFKEKFGNDIEHKRFADLITLLENGVNTQNAIENLARDYADGADYIEKMYRISGLIGLTGKDFHFRDKDAKQIKRDWVNHLVHEKILSIFSNSRIDDGISKTTEHFMDGFETLQKYFEKKGITSPFYQHNNLELLTIGDSDIAAELPVLQNFDIDETKDRYWAGHIDLIARGLKVEKEGNTIFIKDYKPERGLSREALSTHFINTVPQLVAYALIAYLQIDKGSNVRCVIFNDNQAVEFDPIEMFYEIKAFLNGDFIGSNSEAMEEYKKIEPKEIFQDFFTDFEIQIQKIRAKHGL